MLFIEKDASFDWVSLCRRAHSTVSNCRSSTKKVWLFQLQLKPSRGPSTHAGPSILRFTLSSSGGERVADAASLWITQFVKVRMLEANFKSDAWKQFGFTVWRNLERREGDRQETICRNRRHENQHAPTALFSTYCEVQGSIFVW